MTRRAGPLLGLSSAVLLAAGLALPSWPALAQSSVEDWGFDPTVLIADGRELLRRAPDTQLDGLFKALHGASRDPDDAAALCALFAPDADRSLAGLNTAATRLTPEARERFALAVADVLVAATQNPPQPYDEAGAHQALKSAGATAAFLHEDFLPGMTADDAPTRCRSLGFLMDGLAKRPVVERAAVTRMLLLEGLGHVAANLAATGID
ncbi:hypothetical protein GCM10028862_21070 [Luteimonas pelagia]